MLNFTPRPNWWASTYALSSQELHKLASVRHAIRAGAYRDDLYDAHEEARWDFFHFLRYRGKFQGGPDDGSQ